MSKDEMLSESQAALRALRAIKFDSEVVAEPQEVAAVGATLLTPSSH